MNLAILCNELCDYSHAYFEKRSNDRLLKQYNAYIHEAQSYFDQLECIDFDQLKHAVYVFEKNTHLIACNGFDIRVRKRIREKTDDLKKVINELQMKCDRIRTTHIYV